MPVTIEHIIAREIIHFASSGSVVLWMMALLYLVERRGWIRPIGPNLWIALSATFPPFAIFLREAHDSATIGWAGKSYIDFAFWMLGCWSTAALLLWLSPRLDRVRRGRRRWRSGGQ